MALEIGIVGAGKRGRAHASEFAAVDGTQISAVADIDERKARALTTTYDATVYDDYRSMIDQESLDIVAVCVHNNLHRPVTVAAADAGTHVFCEKPLAATVADANAMVEATERAGVELGVQNSYLFTPETRATRTLIEQGELGTPYYGRGVYARRRGRPYIDGYGTPSFVSRESAGGGAVLDIGPYVVGQLLWLFDNASVERVGGKTFEHATASLEESLVGDQPVYEERLTAVDYDVEDAGIGYAHLSDGSLLSFRLAWHMFLPPEPSVAVGSQGGVQLDPFEYYTTVADYEATASLDLETFERRHGLLRSEDGYDLVEPPNQFQHFVETVTGAVDDPIPTGSLALEATKIMEGITLATAAERELSVTEIIDRSTSTTAQS